MRKDYKGRIVNVEETEIYYPWMAKVLLISQSKKVGKNRDLIEMHGTGAIISYNRLRYL